MCLGKNNFFLCVLAKDIFFECPWPNFANKLWEVMTFVACVFLEHWKISTRCYYMHHGMTLLHLLRPWGARSVLPLEHWTSSSKWKAHLHLEIRRDHHSHLTFSFHLSSLLQTVPSAVLDKGKVIADAYRTPADDYVEENAAELDPKLKELEDIL